jgi:hypothetical protein
MLFLKLPIAALLGIVWWAVRQSTEPAEQTGGDGGVQHSSQPRHPHRPRLPRGPRAPYPRRDPHGAAPPASPARVRSAVARVRSLDR